MELKSFTPTPLNDEGGVIKGYAATFDRVPDSYGDIIAPGAFARTISEWAEKGKPVPILWGHNMDDPAYNIGAAYVLKEDEKGLYFEGNLDAESDNAQYVRKLVKEGRVYQFSFSYSVKDAATVRLEDGTQVREIRDADLYEISVVQIPANQHATVEEIKAAEVEEKAGRILSKSNEESISQAIDILQGVLDQLSNDEAEADGDEAAADEQTAPAEGQKSENAEFLEYYKTTIKEWSK